MQDRDVVLLVNPGAWLLNSSPATALVQHVHAGAGFAHRRWSQDGAAWQPDSPLAALMPLQVAGPVPFVPGEILLRLSRPVGTIRSCASPQVWTIPWLRLPPLPGYFRTAQQRPGTSVLVESVGGEPVIAAGAYGKGKVIAALIRVLWATRPDEQRRRWPAADHSDVLVRRRLSGLRSTLQRTSRASTERPVYRAGEEVVSRRRSSTSC